jgi:hypothetical protein
MQTQLVGHGKKKSVVAEKGKKKVPVQSLPNSFEAKLEMNMLSILIQLPQLSRNLKFTQPLLGFIKQDILRLENFDNDKDNNGCDITDNSIGVICSAIRIWCRLLASQEKDIDVSRASSSKYSNMNDGNTESVKGKTKNVNKAKKGRYSEDSDNIDISSEDDRRLSTGSNSSTLFDDSNRQKNLSEEMKQFLEIMFSCMLSRGAFLVPYIQMPSNNPENLEDSEMDQEEVDVHSEYRSALRLVCASSVFELLKLHRISKALTIVQWQMLGNI